jgi:hypothetical protein
MVTISIHEPAPFSGVAYYRSIGTLSFLPKLNKKIQLKRPEQIAWNSLIDTDILYMERPQHHSDLTALEIAKDFNVKVWVDYDDFLHGIPEYNPTYKMYSKPEILERIEQAMTMANVVTVSTPFLKDFYSKFNQNIHVLENAHNDYKYPFKKIEQTELAINWRGSATHREDLLSVKENLVDLSHRHNWGWTFIGNDTWYITDYMKNCYSFSEVDVATYNKFILDLRSAIQIVPLLFSDFNRAKSNIGWIEGTYAGSATIAPLLPEFEKPGVINYMDKPDSFGYYLEKAIKSKSFRKKKYNESYEYIHDNLLLSDLNKKRIEIVEGLLDGK